MYPGKESTKGETDDWRPPGAGAEASTRAYAGAVTQIPLPGLPRTSGRTRVALSGTGDTRAAGSPGSVALAVGLYVGVRLLLVAVIAGVLVVVGLPLLVSLLIAIVVALPLSLVLFRGLRARLTAEVEAATASRRARRDQLRAELRGDSGPEGRS